MIEITELGSTLRTMRKTNRLTLKQASELTGLSLSFLSDVERGIVDPSLTTLQKLALCYGKPITITFQSDEWSGYEI